MLSDDEIRLRYGADVVISHWRGFALIHLDRPGDAVIGERTRHFDPDLFFEAGCPLCELQRLQRICLFDDYPNADEDVELE